jgi:hypothetical protein
LLELLVAVTITLVLAGLVLAITLNTLGLWRRIQDDFTGAAQVRLVFDMIERDLQGAFRRDDSGHWLAAEIQNSAVILRDRHGWLVDVPEHGCSKPATELSLDALPPPFPAGPGIAGARFGLGGVWLRLFSLESSGLPAAVSYQIVRRPITGEASLTNPAAPRYLLYRTTVDNTLVHGHDVMAGYDDLLAAPAADDVLAENVVDFGVLLYVRDDSMPDGLKTVFPVSADETAVFVAPGGGDSLWRDHGPEVADVVVRMLTDEGATLVANLERGRGRSQSATDSEWWKLVEAHSTVFVDRIELKGAER